MSYQYLDAIARSKTQDNRWGQVDLSQVPLNAIYSDYSKVYLTLLHVPTNRTVYLDMDAVRELAGIDTRPRPLAGWLTGLGNQTLPTQSFLPQLKTYRMQYADAWRAGYDIRPVVIGRHPDSQINPGSRNDLLLQKDGVDFRQWGRYCLVTVNGMFHRVGTGPEGLYVIDGARSGRIANDNQIGIHSFREVGSLDLIPITPDMIYKSNPNQRYENFANIRLPYSVEDKTVLLVLGGYLHVLDRAYRQTSAQSIQIDFNNYKLPERIYDSGRLINLESLRLENSPNNEYQHSVRDLYSDETLIKYMTLPQSFLVVVNATNLYVRRHPLENTGLPGRYIAPEPMERYPMFSALGRCFDYRAFPQEGRTVLASTPATEQHYNFQTVDWKVQNAVDPTRYSADPWRFADAYLMEIGRT